MGDNKISEAVHKLAYETGEWYSQNEKCQPGVPFYAFTQGEMDRFVEKLSHLQGDAVPVAYIEHSADKLLQMTLTPDGLALGVGRHPVFAHPQPAELSEVSGDSGELADGPVHAAIEDVLSYASHHESCGDSDSYNNAEIPSCGCGFDAAVERLEAALAATGNQQVGEVQGDALATIIAALENSKPTHDHYPEPVKLHADALAHARALASRQPEGEPLWCMHILGPDDVHAAPSKAHAEKAAAALNAFHAAREEQSEHDPKVEAVVAPWPHSAESHAESVADFIPGWLLPRWQVEAIQTDAAPPAQGIDLGQLTRYDLNDGWDRHRDIGTDKGAHLYEHDDGDWVKWEDVQALIDQRDAGTGVTND